MFFDRRANELKDFMIRCKLENKFDLVETDLIYSYGHKYSFYRIDDQGTRFLVNSFEVDSDTRELDSLAMFEYCLGFMDSYLIMNKEVLKAS